MAALSDALSAMDGLLLTPQFGSSTRNPQLCRAALVVLVVPLQKSNPQPWWWSARRY